MLRVDRNEPTHMLHDGKATEAKVDLKRIELPRR